MSEETEKIPSLLLKGRSALMKEYSRERLSKLSKRFRERDVEELYVIDIDGLERNLPQLDIVQYLSDDFSILLEAGPRRGANVIDLIVAGADKVFMNTYSMDSLEEIALARSLTENVGLKIDWNRGLLGWGEGIDGASLEDVLSEARAMGTDDFVIPIEILDITMRSMRDDKAVIRAISDRPGDENTTDDRIDSLIVDHELLFRGVSE